MTIAGIMSSQSQRRLLIFVSILLLFLNAVAVFYIGSPRIRGAGTY